MPTPSPARLHDFTVVANEAIGEDLFALTMHAPALAHSLAPGQFMDIAVPGNAMSLLRVPVSFAFSDPDAGTVEIWYAVVGDGTRRLSHMMAGERSTVLGPGGHGWDVPADADACPRALLVAGGIGVPPIVALARALSERGIPFDASLGAQRATKMVGIDALKALPGCGVVAVSTDDGSAGRRGFCTDPAAELLSQNAYGYVATCGPGVMMKKVAASAAAAGVPCQASLERMMSCGFGACNTCNVETVDGMRGACTCGPVFDASKVVVW